VAAFQIRVKEKEDIIAARTRLRIVSRRPEPARADAVGLPELTASAPRGSRKERRHDRH
jgi:hypothetical protein